MAIDIHPVRPEEFEAAGTATAEAFREHSGAELEACPERAEWEWIKSYLVLVADIADRAQRAAVLVAVEGDEALGTVTVELDDRVNRAHGDLAEGEAHIRMLGVAPAARGRRVGKDLMLAAIELARSRQRTHVTLGTIESMKVAQHLYESLGFVRTAEEMTERGKYFTYRLNLSDPAKSSPP